MKNQKNNNGDIMSIASVSNNFFIIENFVNKNIRDLRSSKDSEKYTKSKEQGLKPDLSDYTSDNRKTTFNTPDPKYPSVPNYQDVTKSNYASKAIKAALGGTKSK